MAPEGLDMTLIQLFTLAVASALLLLCVAVLQFLWNAARDAATGLRYAVCKGFAWTGAHLRYRYAAGAAALVLGAVVTCWAATECFPSARPACVRAGQSFAADSQATSARFVEMRPFREGLAAVRVGRNWGFADRNGALVIAPVFNHVLDFREGFCAVSIRGQWGYIDRTGRCVIDLRYRAARSFSNGLAAVNEHYRWGFIGCDGTQAIAPRFIAASQFHNGLAAVGLVEEGLCMIDRAGNLVARGLTEVAWPARAVEGRLRLARHIAEVGAAN